MIVSEFLNQLYSASDSDESIDLIYNVIDDLCQANNFLEIDRTLSCVDLQKLSLTQSLAFLTITCNYKEQLRSRADLFEDVKKKIIGVGREKDLESLLIGLE